MLPAPSRLSRREDFTLAVRRGQKVAGPGLVLHHHGGDGGTAKSRVGFVVGRPVGNAATRNLLRRRLRHAMSARLDALPPGSRVVVRATPTAAGRSFDQLCDTLDGLIGRAFGPGAAP